MIEKLKQLSKETAVYGVSTIVGRFLNFLLVPLYTNVFTTSEFGIFSNIYAYLAFLNIVFIFGMDAAFMKYFSLSEDRLSKTKTFSTPVIFTTITSVLLCVILYLFHEQISEKILIPPDFSYLSLYVIAILFFDTLTLIPFAYLRMERKPVKFATIKILNICINFSLNLILILVFDFGIEAIFISNLAASILSMVLLIPDFMANFSLSIDYQILKKMLKFGLPYLPASIAAVMVQLVDVPIVRALTDDSTLGIYRANYKLGIFMMLFVQMFSYAWQPFFLTNAKEKNAKELFSKVLTLFLLAASLIWVVLSLFLDDLAKIEFFHGKSLIGKEYIEGIIIIPVILLAYIFHGMYINFTAGIYIEEKTKYFPMITGIGAVSNVISNLLLIPILGILGAAISTLISYILMAAGLFFTSQRFYKIEYEYGKIIKILSVITLTSIVYYLFLDAGNTIPVIKFIVLIVFVLSLFLLKVIRIR